MNNYLTATGTKVEETSSAAALADSVSIRAYAKDAVTRIAEGWSAERQIGQPF